jgi:hypothetical protein
MSKLFPAINKKTSVSNLKVGKCYKIHNTVVNATYSWLGKEYPVPYIKDSRYIENGSILTIIGFKEVFDSEFSCTDFQYTFLFENETRQFSFTPDVTWILFEEIC